METPTPKTPQRTADQRFLAKNVGVDLLRRRNHKSVRGVGLMILFLMIVGRALGDSRRPYLLETHIAESPLIVVGTVTRIESAAPLPGGFPSTEICADLKVVQILKNVSTNRVTIGETIPFFAHLSNDTLATIRPKVLPRVDVWFFDLPRRGRWCRAGICYTNLVPQIIAEVKKQQRDANGSEQPVRSGTNEHKSAHPVTPSNSRTK